MSKVKKAIAATVVTGALVVGTSTASQAAIPKPIKDVFDATIGRIASTFTSISNQYLGGLIDEYLPRGFEAVIGELGLPDPGGIFDEIRAKIQRNDDSHVDPRFSDSLTSWGNIQIGNTSAEVAQKLAEGYFSEDVQSANAQGDKALLDSVETANAANESLQGMDVTQDILKKLGDQNSALITVQAGIAQKLAQQNQQSAGANFALGEMAKSNAEDNQERIIRLSDESKAALGKASFGTEVLLKK